MYEQSAASRQVDDEKLMNTAVEASKDKDIEDVKSLGESTAGSLFLKSATKTTEDTLRKLREDPLFQIRRQEQAARQSMLSNPLVLAKLQKRQDKQTKKDEKQMKKRQKKLKKAEKKAKKAAKKAEKGGKKRKAGTSSSSSDSSDEAGRGPAAKAVRSDRGDLGGRPAGRAGGADEACLGPNSAVVDQRQEAELQRTQRRDAALASRGAARRMTDEERQQRLDQMQTDASRHERHKDKRIAAAELKEKEVEEKEKDMRNNSSQQYFRDIRAQAYMGDGDASVADRLQNQRHRRQKHINDPLERDG